MEEYFKFKPSLNHYPIIPRCLLFFMVMPTDAKDDQSSLVLLWKQHLGANGLTEIFHSYKFKKVFFISSQCSI